jgi:hypothetical protein
MAFDEVQTHSFHRQQYFFQATPMLAVFIVLVCNFHSFETKTSRRCYNIASNVMCVVEEFQCLLERMLLAISSLVCKGEVKSET